VGRCPHVLAAAAILAGVLAPPARAEPALTILQPESLALKAHDGDAATVTVRNETGKPVTAQVLLELDEGTGTVEPASITLGAYEVKGFPFGVTADEPDRDTSGMLVIQPDDAAAAAVPITVEPDRPYDWPVSLVIYVPFALALVVVLVCVGSVRDLGAQLGPANWDYSQSWATTLTVIGGFLGTVLGASVLPDETELLPRNAYGALNLAFALLVLVAPLVYAAAQKRAKDDHGVPQYTGTVFAFGVASVATLWGVFGQILTLALVLRELWVAASLPATLVVALFAVMGIAALAVLVYSCRRMTLILRDAPRATGRGIAVGPRPANAWNLL
jgi:hypothetical protein